MLQSNRVVLFMKGDPTSPRCAFRPSDAPPSPGYASVTLADAEIRGHQGIRAMAVHPAASSPVN
jgi:glutaredoxin-related protein